MARPREFDTDAALDDAIDVFREHGFEGSSAQMLVDAMGIGRQSLYAHSATSGSSIARRCDVTGWASARAFRCAAKRRARDRRDRAMLHRVVETADQPCLGVSSTYEFGASRPDLEKIKTLLGKTLRGAIVARVRDGQREDDIAARPRRGGNRRFLIANIAGIRVAGRGGADRAALASLAEMALRALR